MKRAVLHGSNASFNKTLNGAQIGDLFMGLIHTAELCDTDAFGYLIARSVPQRLLYRSGVITLRGTPKPAVRALDRAGKNRARLGEL